MARNIHGSYFEDTYVKYECHSCKRSFIVGEALSENMKLACPYCACPGIEMTAASADETAEDMDMGCLGIYFNRYDDGQLMLYTEREFARALNNSLKSGGGDGVPLNAVCEIMRAYCAERDGRDTIPPS